MTRAIALILTVMTGFSGLVYEIAWQKYLATLLGSHSEATAAVLAIFLGGLSVGYWLFGVVTRRVVENAARAGTPPRLLLVYGGLEFSIGVYVIAFPWLFKVVQALSFAIPHGSGGFGFAIDVALTVLLIGPASVTHCLDNTRGSPPLFSATRTFLMPPSYFKLTTPSHRLPFART